MKSNAKVKPAPPAVPLGDAWRPSWMWHVKVLAGIYIFLTVFYFAVDHWLSRLPEPYRLRDVPMEMTPWLKK
jgi:hypothetical protein